MFKIRKSVLDYNYYYLCNEKNNQSALDREVATAMGTDVETFRKTMLEVYNGRIRRVTGEVWFKGKEDAEKALGYITGIMVANKLKKAK